MISLVLSAHNEEENIRNILLDIINEMNSLNERSELFIGLSHCVDNTEKIARKTIQHSQLPIKIIKTPLGKINSQKTILQLINKKSWGVLFLDSDIRLEESAIKNMIKEAHKYTNVKLFYATETPIQRKSIFYNIINVRTLNPQYVIAKENVTDFHPYSKNKKKKVFLTGGMYLLRKGVYDIDKKAIGDDSYLTHSVYHRFGFGTIKQTESSIIYYQPVYTFHSWIHKWKRIWSDIDHLYLYHPEFKYLEKYMNLTVDFKKLLKERKIKLFFYFFLERTWNTIGMFVFKKFFFKKYHYWYQLKDTKKITLQ